MWYRVIIKGPNMPITLPSVIPPQPSISSELEALRRVEIGQPALPADPIAGPSCLGTFALR